MDNLITPLQISAAVRTSGKVRKGLRIEVGDPSILRRALLFRKLIVFMLLGDFLGIG